jgi:FKBP-type peptidyl-prolyl cis-trans isomerase
MYKFSLVSFGGLLLLGACDQVNTQTTQDSVTQDLVNQTQKISYLYGMDSARNIESMGIEFDANAFQKGFNDGINGVKPRLSESQISDVMRIFQAEMSAKREAQQKLADESTALQSESNRKEGNDFLSANKQKSGVMTTGSGLQYRVIRSGAGVRPNVKSTVEVHYVGRLLDGTEFDSSLKRGVPAQFGVTQVIPGWTEALQLMREGAKWELFIPADLAYGPAGQGPIGPNETLVFEVELLKADI